MAHESNRPHLVVVGSSAGGIEALSRLVATLPEDFPAAMVLAQHLYPGRDSQLVPILERHSMLPVRSVTNHAHLEPGVVFVVPANEHVVVSDHEITLVGDGDNRPSPSIDQLFDTSSTAYGSDLIAVILTGTGSDGAAGARAVKQAGGTVIIENPETAEFPSMPLSLSPTLIDFTVDLDNVGPLVSKLVTRMIEIDRADVQSDDQLSDFLSHLRRQSNIDFSRYRTPTIWRRLQRRMIATGTDSLANYRDYLTRNPQEYQVIVSTFLIKVTEFFRDEKLFSVLRDSILPELIKYGRENGNQLRFWSAGCATGEEAYSLAIILAELLGDELNMWNIRIFATDLDLNAISYARRGVYPYSAISKMPEELVNRYFSEYGDEYEVNKQVRSLVIFGQHDLGRRSPFPRIDLILCRNVLIYFTEELQRRALRLFAFSLRHEGILALGKSESASGENRSFILENAEARIYRRYGEVMVLPDENGDSINTFAPILQPPHPPARSGTQSEPGIPRHEKHQVMVASERIENLLFNLPVGIAVVDEHYDIVMINNIARRLLGIHGLAVGEDLIHLTRTIPLDVLRDTIDRTFREKELREIAVDLSGRFVGEQDSTLRNTSYVHEIEHDGDKTNTVVLMLNDVSEPNRELRQLREALATRESENREAEERAQRLEHINHELYSSNSELASANEQLRRFTQQLQVAHEESQVAAEEIETLNEELQATNEELETLNEELQATVEELNATNEDMMARTAELQETAVSLEEQRRTSDRERARLEAVLGSMSEIVLVVNENGVVSPMNEVRMLEVLGAPLDELVLQDDSGEQLDPGSTPQAIAAQGETFRMQFTLSVEGGGRRWFEASGRPIPADALPWAMFSSSGISLTAACVACRKNSCRSQVMSFAHR